MTGMECALGLSLGKQFSSISIWGEDYSWLVFAPIQSSNRVQGTLIGRLLRWFCLAVCVWVVHTRSQSFRFVFLVSNWPGDFFIAQLNMYKCYFATSAEHLILRAFVICIGEHLTTINNMNQLRDIRPIIVHLVPERAQRTARQLVSWAKMIQSLLVRNIAWG